MKCFKLAFILIFLISFNLLAQEKEVGSVRYLTLFAKEEIEVLNGDLLWLPVKTNLKLEDLKQLKNKRIHERIYLFDIKKEMDDILFHVIITNPPLKKNSKGLKSFVQIDESVKLRFDKSRATKSFILLDQSIPPKKNYLWYYIGFSCLGLILLVVLWKYVPKYYKKYQLKKAKTKYAKKIISEIQNATERNDFEKIYIRKNEIKALIRFEGDDPKKFFKVLNEIQYKKTWTQSDVKLLKNSFESLGRARVKNGI